MLNWLRVYWPLILFMVGGFSVCMLPDAPDGVSRAGVPVCSLAQEEDVGC